MLRFQRTDSSNLHFQALVRLLDADLKIRDGEDHAFYDQFNKIDTIKWALLAYQHNTPVGCGALKEYSPGTAELKRMYVLPEFRRQGVARHLLSQLELWATELQFQYLILETGKAQPEAIALYTRCNYRPIPNYGQYVGIENSICMQKNLLR